MHSVGITVLGHIHSWTTSSFTKLDLKIASFIQNMGLRQTNQDMCNSVTRALLVSVTGNSRELREPKQATKQDWRMLQGTRKYSPPQQWKCYLKVWENARATRLQMCTQKEVQSAQGWESPTLGRDTPGEKLMFHLLHIGLKRLLSVLQTTEYLFLSFSRL